MSARDPFLPETAADALAQWDAEKSLPIRAVVIGGLGPSYEQCIYIAIFELIRDALESNAEIPALGTDAFDWGSATLSRIDEPLGGLSGMQWGSAQNFALFVLREGWAKAVGKILEGDARRMIMVQRAFPALTNGLKRQGEPS